jgi:Restriction endonuclease
MGVVRPSSRRGILLLMRGLWSLAPVHSDRYSGAVTADDAERTACTPRQYEALVAAKLEAEGYSTQLGPYTRDWGVDVIACRGRERLAVQAKMYSGSTRRVGRECLLQLHGAAAYFDCTGALLATDGLLTEEAILVARKLHVRVMTVPAATGHSTPCHATRAVDFDRIWEQYVMPLAGRTLTRSGGSSNGVIAVDWVGLERITSSGARQFIPVEIFRFAIERVLRDGAITRDEINQHYPGRGSSGITLVLAQVPLFEVGGRPQTVRLKGP